MANVAQLLASQQRLIAVSDTPKLDVELLLCHCLQKNKSYLRTWPEADVSAEAEAQFESLLKRRQVGEPIAYLMGERGFWTLDLQVSSATLIPRPETELLVEVSLQLLALNPTASVLDLGTGTGAIALALASEQPQWQIEACDQQIDAVNLAKLNQTRCNINNVQIYQSDWFSNVEPQLFDLIVSNPPYIDANDEHLKQGDVRFEPRSALVAGNQGLADIEKIIAQAHAFLNVGGWLLFEHGYQQAHTVRALLQAVGFSQVFTRQDLSGHDRISGGSWQDGVNG